MTSAIVSGLQVGAAHAISELGEIAGTLETVFLDAGNGLAEAVECWRSISTSFTALAGQFDREDIQRCIDELGATLAVAAALGGAGGGGAKTLLMELAEGLGAMRARLERLSRTVAEVKLVALNAKVEAAHLDGRSTDFSVFTREIDRLAASATAELAMLEGELRQLADETAGAHREQASFNDNHGSELLTVSRRLDDDLKTLARQRRQVADAATSIGERSRQAGDRVAQAVLALQIGDITRQRTEHVAEALGLMAGLQSGGDGLDADDIGQASALVATLQSRQLEQTAGDMEREVGQVTTTLTAMAGEMDAIARLGNESFGSEGGSSFLESLGREIAHIQTLLEGYATAFSRTEAIMASVAQATAAMVAHVEAIHSIEADLKIMALNASFKCSRLGDQGRTLSVVAQSLRHLATRTVEDAAVLMSGLQSAMATARSLAQGGQDQGGGAITSAITSLREAAALLTTIGAEQSAALELLHTDSRRAQQLLTAVADGIAGSRDFVRRLRSVAGDLTSASEDTVIDPDRVEQLKDLVLTRLAGNYTMASERTLHDLFGGGEEAAAGTADNIDDLFF
jgi:methyl-accepting chemotaxis protein